MGHLVGVNLSDTPVRQAGPKQLLIDSENETLARAAAPLYRIAPPNFNDIGPNYSDTSRETHKAPLRQLIWGRCLPPSVQDGCVSIYPNMHFTHSYLLGVLLSHCSAIFDVTHVGINHPYKREFTCPPIQIRSYSSVFPRPVLLLRHPYVLHFQQWIYGVLAYAQVKM